MSWTTRVAIGGVLIGFAVGTSAWAQQSKYQRQKLALTAGLGVASYSGDLNAYTPRYLRPAVSVGGLYQFHPHVAARAEIRLFQLEGSQANTPNFRNNLSFRSTSPDFWAGLEVSLLPVHRPKGFNLALYTGLGLSYLSPKALYQETWVSLPPLRTENVRYSRLVGVVPAGLILEYRLNVHYAFQAEISYTYTLSDYLDDVSTVYPSPDQLPSDLARTLSDRRPELGEPPNQPGFTRGNPSSNDTYIMAQLKLKRYFTTVSRNYRRSLRCYR